MKDSGDHRFVIAPVSREDDRDARWADVVGKTNSFPHLAVMVFSGETQSVIDSVGIRLH
jgi:hypothetical protein